MTDRITVLHITSYPHKQAANVDNFFVMNDSVGVNATHGLRRTNQDKRRAVETLLGDNEWAKWSGEEIARRAGVSAMFVSNMRKDLSLNYLEIDRYVQRNGTTYTQNTANIGRSQVLTVEPEREGKNEGEG